MKKNILGGVLAGAMLFAGAAFAGPQMTFGPNGEGLLQLDYKGQFQLVVRDTGSGANKSDTTADFNFISFHKRSLDRPVVRQIYFLPRAVMKIILKKRKIAAGIAFGTDITLGGIFDEVISGRQYPWLKHRLCRFDIYRLCWFGIGKFTIRLSINFRTHIEDQIIWFCC